MWKVQCGVSSNFRFMSFYVVFIPFLYRFYTVFINFSCQFTKFMLFYKIKGPFFDYSAIFTDFTVCSKKVSV